MDYTKTKLVERELLLIKVSILGPEHLHEQLPTHKLDDDTEYEDEIVSRYESVSLTLKRVRREKQNLIFLLNRKHMLPLLIPFVRLSLTYVL